MEEVTFKDLKESYEVNVSVVIGSFKVNSVIGFKGFKGFFQVIVGTCQVIVNYAITTIIYNIRGWVNFEVKLIPSVPIVLVDCIERGKLVF